MEQIHIREEGIDRGEMKKIPKCVKKWQNSRKTAQHAHFFMFLQRIFDRSGQSPPQTPFYCFSINTFSKKLWKSAKAFNGTFSRENVEKYERFRQLGHGETGRTDLSFEKTSLLKRWPPQKYLWFGATIWGSCLVVLTLVWMFEFSSISRKI